MQADNLRNEVEAFLKKHQISATRFGVLAAGDTKFVKSLRKGRQCRESTKAEVRRYMQQIEGER